MSDEYNFTDEEWAAIKQLGKWLDENCTAVRDVDLDDVKDFEYVSDYGMNWTLKRDKRHPNSNAVVKWMKKNNGRA